MLTAELVKVRRKGDELTLAPLSAADREMALGLAGDLVRTAHEHVGRTRAELDEALGEVPVSAKDRRLFDGLRKLLEDACEIDGEGEADVPELRRDVFLLAAKSRREGTFDRDSVLAEVATARGVSSAEIDAMLYSDLRAAHVLRSVETPHGEALVARYEASRAQAVMLKATHVTVLVLCASPAAYRGLFRRLKFLQLLVTIHAVDGGGYRLEIDGPLSLFEATTKYGLRLAMLIPMLEECAAYELAADVRWGKNREALRFRMRGGAGPDARPSRERLPDDVQALRRGIEAQGDAFRATPAEALLSLPGVGVIAPDLVVTEVATKIRVYVEILGWWSREAVWKRVDLIEKGLGERVVFAVSERLRVSADVLGDDVPGCLYVYKGAMSARTVLARVKDLAGRPMKRR